MTSQQWHQTKSLTQSSSKRPHRQTCTKNTSSNFTASSARTTDLNTPFRPICLQHSHHLYSANIQPPLIINTIDTSSTTHPGIPPDSIPPRKTEIKIRFELHPDATPPTNASPPSALPESIQQLPIHEICRSQRNKQIQQSQRTITPEEQLKWNKIQISHLNIKQKQHPAQYSITTG
jgi:hypothetical protein